MSIPFIIPIDRTIDQKDNFILLYRKAKGLPLDKDSFTITNLTSLPFADPTGSTREEINSKLQVNTRVTIEHLDKDQAFNQVTTFEYHRVSLSLLYNLNKTKKYTPLPKEETSPDSIKTYLKEEGIPIHWDYVEITHQENDSKYTLSPLDPDTNLLYTSSISFKYSTTDQQDPDPEEPDPIVPDKPKWDPPTQVCISTGEVLDYYVLKFLVGDGVDKSDPPQLIKYDYVSSTIDGDQAYEKLVEITNDILSKIDIDTHLPLYDRISTKNEEGHSTVADFHIPYYGTGGDYRPVDDKYTPEQTKAKINKWFDNYGTDDDYRGLERVLTFYPRVEVTEKDKSSSPKPDKVFREHFTNFRVGISRLKTIPTGGGSQLFHIRGPYGPTFVRKDEYESDFTNVRADRISSVYKIPRGYTISPKDYIAKYNQGLEWFVSNDDEPPETINEVIVMGYNLAAVTFKLKEKDKFQVLDQQGDPIPDKYANIGWYEMYLAPCAVTGYDQYYDKDNGTKEGWFNRWHTITSERPYLRMYDMFLPNDYTTQSSGGGRSSLAIRKPIGTGGGSSSSGSSGGGSGGSSGGGTGGTGGAGCKSSDGSVSYYNMWYHLGTIHEEAIHIQDDGKSTADGWKDQHTPGREWISSKVSENERITHYPDSSHFSRLKQAAGNVDEGGALRLWTHGSVRTGAYFEDRDKWLEGPPQAEVNFIKCPKRKVVNKQRSDGYYVFKSTTGGSMPDELTSFLPVSGGTADKRLNALHGLYDGCEIKFKKVEEYHTFTGGDRFRSESIGFYTAEITGCLLKKGEGTSSSYSTTHPNIEKIGFHHFTNTRYAEYPDDSND